MEPRVEKDVAKHLEFVQAVIIRMSNNSFLLKGWTVTLSAGLVALVANGLEGAFAFVVLLPAIAFWWLDAYYLRQERLYRRLYDDVRNGSVEEFSLSTHKYVDEVQGNFRALWTSSVFWFHIAVIVAVALVVMGLLLTNSPYAEASAKTSSPEAME